MGEAKVLGIDIGATKIHVGVVQDGVILQEAKWSTSAQAPQAQIISELIAVVEGLMTPDILGIGIGVPGLVDEQAGVIYDLVNIPSWQEVPLKAVLEKYFNKPVYLSNDGNSFVLGEKLYGQGKEFRNLVGITLGTGFGTGIVVHDQLYSGTLSSAGEFGGMPYLDKTIEDYCSGKFFQHKLNAPGTTVYEQAQAGDAAALAAFEEYGFHVGNALKTILYSLSPEAIFLGGSISACYDLFKDSLRDSLQAFPFKRVLARLVVAPSAMHNAAILGAAALVTMKSASRAQPQLVA